QVVASPALRSELKGDLDHIVLHALRKNPADRYPTVQQFVEDIRRLLSARPIEARPPTTSYRVRQFWNENRRRRGPLKFATVLLLAGIAALVAIKFQRSERSSAGNLASASGVNEQKSIAVLPFDSLDNRPDDSYFVDGIQDNILTDLAKVSELKVISRSGVERYRGARKDAQLIGRDLDVAYVLEGSVQKSGDRLRVNVRLVDTRNN